MKSFALKDILRPHIANLAPYSSARDEYTGKVGVFLDANENPIGSVSDHCYNRYPDPYQAEIKARISPIKKIGTEQIFLGNGSDEPIDLLIRATCRPAIDRILIMPPTYGMYEVSASIHDVPVDKVPLTADYQIEVDKVLNAVVPETKIIWICTPNNPTGNCLESSVIEKIVRNFSGLVVVDEAYIDFANTSSWLDRLAEFPNLVVLQTFSKAWGLAGLRVGMCFASEELVRILNKIKPPYNISLPAQQALMSGLDSAERKDVMVEEILKEREKLRTMLSQLSFVLQIFPSDANFLLVRFSDASAVMSYLIEHTIIVRDRSKVFSCEGCLRISVGTTEENMELIEALKSFPLPI
ncbi:histidinol-phosphate transaminase [Dyadobacter tibetensis]|uniref:histidinol-phosphate transaminase n=1 Tax=Dyadobacter tibetensis TaxID=1211851 RepID=UPI000470F5D7|nr:histidinol-phosphate transaminase [Dyadobacter tibetensis]